MEGASPFEKYMQTDFSRSDWLAQYEDLPQFGRNGGGVRICQWHLLVEKWEVIVR